MRVMTVSFKKYSHLKIDLPLSNTDKCQLQTHPNATQGHRRKVRKSEERKTEGTKTEDYCRHRQKNYNIQTLRMNRYGNTDWPETQQCSVRTEFSTLNSTSRSTAFQQSEEKERESEKKTISNPKRGDLRIKNVKMIFLPFQNFWHTLPVKISTPQFSQEEA